MLDHHIQKAIVYRLAFSPGLRFSELQPDELDNKLFDYHLKQVILAGLVKKATDGTYALTAKGRKIGVGVLDKQFLALERAHSVAFLIIQRPSDKAWLLFKRQTHPLFGRVGLMHINPVIEKDIITNAQDELREITGLQAIFAYAGSGFFKVFLDGDLESFTNFTVLAAKNVKGNLESASKKGDYFWVSDLNAVKDQLLPTAAEIIKRYQSGKNFFVDKTFNL
jgi:hypothetical protein